MEGLSLRAYLVAGALLLMTGWVYLTPRPGKVAGKDEAWMGKVAPAKVANYTFIAGSEDPLCTYKSPEMVYKSLVPTVGILARVYEYQGQRFDVNLIASRDKASFHDPRVCFTAQDYTITEEQAIQIKTTTRGKISATLAKMTTPKNEQAIAVFFYRSNHGFFADTTRLKFSMLWDQIWGRTDIDTVFYRFIPDGDVRPEKLIEFIATYMDTAGATSKGYF
jgi:hypothetical protein